MSSESKQRLLEIVLMVLALIVLASAPARGGGSMDPVDADAAIATARR